MSASEKYRNLLSLLKAQGSAAVAFSGGVDSSFLCRAAVDALGERAVAFTLVSPLLPKSEIEDARRVASLVGIAHHLIEDTELDESVVENAPDRCYRCKKVEFGRIIDAARKRGIAVVLDGSNLDDLGDYRPGLKALEELRVRSPLREAGMTKADIRELSRERGLPTWNKQAFACLASRFPYGERISREKLERVEKAEEHLRSLGFSQYRVRSHGEIARIEVSPSERRRFFDERFLDDLSGKLKALGFAYVALELEGYAVGSLNRVLKTPPKEQR